LDVARSAQ